MKACWTMTVVLAAAALGAPGLRGEEAAGAFRPWVVVRGGDSKVLEPGFHAVTEPAAWYALWGDHVGAGPQAPYDTYYNPAGAPWVDFSRCMVLAVFMGRGINSAGVKAVAVTEEEECLRFRFDEWSFQTKGGAVESAAFGFFVVPRSRKLVVFEENVQGLIGGPPQWRERARVLPGLKSMKGWELYAWTAGDGSRRFSLLPGTNRIKEYDTVTSPVNLLDLDGLLERLARLAPGQEIIASPTHVEVPAGRPALEAPGAEEGEAIGARCKTLGLVFDSAGPKDRKG